MNNRVNSFDNDFAHFNDDEDAAKTDDNSGDEFTHKPAFRLGIVGVGQCGNNMAAAFYKTGYRKVLAINTAESDLRSIAEPVEKLLIDKQGAGKDPNVGRECVTAKATKIRMTMSDLFNNRVDKIVVCLGLGGGTGSGGGPEVVKIAKDLMKSWQKNPDRDVIVIATLPEYNIDGCRVCRNALLAYKELENLGVPRLYVDNTQIRKRIRTTFGENWPRMNEWVVKTFHQFNSYANRYSEFGVFDGRDMDDILSRGRLIFSAFRVETLDSQQTIGDIMVTHLERSLFAATDLGTANAAGCVMILNEPAVRDRNPAELHSAFIKLNSLIQRDSVLHRGVYLDTFNPTKKGGEVPDLFCYVMLGGLDHPRTSLEPIFHQAGFPEEEYGTLSAFLD